MDGKQNIYILPPMTTVANLQHVEKVGQIKKFTSVGLVTRGLRSNRTFHGTTSQYFYYGNQSTLNEGVRDGKVTEIVRLPESRFQCITIRPYCDCDETWSNGRAYRVMSESQNDVALFRRSVQLFARLSRS